MLFLFTDVAAQYEGSTNVPSEATLIRTVTTRVRPLVSASFRAQTASGRFSALAGLETEIVDEIMALLRNVILQEVRNQLVIIQQTTVTVVNEPVISKVTKLFGISGANTVEVQTPTHNYAYEH